MPPAQFKTKWQRFSGKETAAYQEHFNDLCRLLRLPTPAEADPTGNDIFCFQKYVLKDTELFSLSPAGEVVNASEERGFADVWKAGCFAWEYKGKRANLDAAYKQLLRYRESLLNPPPSGAVDFLSTNGENINGQHTCRWQVPPLRVRCGNTRNSFGGVYGPF